MPIRCEVAGLVPYSAEIPEAGFLLPIFKGADQLFYVQIPDVKSKTIESFQAVDGVSDHELICPANAIEANVNSPLVYAFKSADHIVIGTLSTIRPELEKFLNINTTDYDILLQIIELIDTGSPRAINLKRKYVEQSRMIYGFSATKNFVETSLFLDELWTAIVRRTKEDKLSELAAARRWILLDAQAENEKIFSEEVEKWLKSTLNLNMDELRSEIASSAIPVESRAGGLNEPWQRELKAIEAEPRQEGRIARILQRVMENPEVGLTLVRNYRDTAAFANKALALLQVNASNLRWNPQSGFASWLVDELYKMAYPRQRGILLYELASHVGKYPTFADAIRRRAHSSNADSVVFAREAIVQCLDNPLGPKPGLPPRPDYTYGGGIRYVYGYPKKD